MKSTYLAVLVSCILWSVTACTTMRPAEQAECVGTVMEMPPGFEAVNKPEVLAEAVGKEGKGGVCTGRVFRANYPFTIYRVWDAKKNNQIRNWWSFVPPQGPRETYRDANAICNAYNDLDRVSTCTLKVGALVVVGPGQSMKCDEKTYPKSAVNQLFVHGENGNIPVENCLADVKWPPPLQ